MNPRDFMDLAWELLGGMKQAEWRSAVSRAYYAAFHVARGLLRQAGFAAPLAENAHAYVWLRLSNSGHPDVQIAGAKLSLLRSGRNLADYELQRTLNQATATDQVRMASDIIQLLTLVEGDPVIRTRITDAMKLYERDVLRVVTWYP